MLRPRCPACERPSAFVQISCCINAQHHRYYSQPEEGLLRQQKTRLPKRDGLEFALMKESAAAAFQTASLEESFIMTHHQMRFQLAESVDGDTDNDQQTGPAEE